MGIKSYRPYTPSRRHMTGSDFSEITKTTPEKSLLEAKSKTAGVNTINVYDVLKYNTVIVTKAAVATIEEVYA